MGGGGGVGGGGRERCNMACFSIGSEEGRGGGGYILCSTPLPFYIIKVSGRKARGL